MSDDISYTADDVPLNHPDGCWYLLDARPVGLSLERRSADMLIPGRDGFMSDYDETVGATMIGLKFACNSVIGKSINDTYQALMSVLNKRGKAVKLIRTQFDHSTTAEAKFVSVNTPEFIETYDSITFVVVMEIPAVFWRDLTDNTQTLPIGTDASGGTVSDRNYRLTTVDNSSAEVRDAIFKIIGPTNSFKIVDLSLGAGFTYVASIAANKQVIVNCKDGTAYNTNLGANWDALTYASRVDTTSSLRTLGIGSNKRIISLTAAPFGGDPFDRRCNVAVTATGLTGSSSLQVLSRRAYY